MRVKSLFQLAGCHNPNTQGICHISLDISRSLTQSSDYRVWSFWSFTFQPGTYQPWINSGYIYPGSPSAEDACTPRLSFCSLSDKDQSKCTQPLLIWGLSQYSILLIDASLPFDTGHWMLNGLLHKHFFTQLETTKLGQGMLYVSLVPKIKKYLKLCDTTSGDL